MCEAADRVMYTSVLAEEGLGLLEVEKEKEPTSRSPEDGVTMFDEMTKEDAKCLNKEHNTDDPDDIEATKQLEDQLEGEGEDPSFRVLGIQLSSFSSRFQMLFCSSGVIAFFLVYGYLQEYITVHLFDRKYGIFLTLYQFIGYSVLAALSQLSQKQGLEKRIPWSYYVLLGTMQAVSQGLGTVSMRWLNYTSKVLFKSAKLLPTMAVGMLCLKARYKREDYMVAILVSIGLFVFVEADAKVTPTFHPAGVICMSIAITLEAAIINIQEYALRRYQASHDEMVLYSYSLGIVALAAASVASNELVEGVAFLRGCSVWSNCVVAFYCTSGFLGVSCLTACTKKFGAFTSTVSTAARKAFALILSFVVFPKPVNMGHWMGGSLLMIGLGVQVAAKSH